MIARIINNNLSPDIQNLMTTLGVTPTGVNLMSFKCDLKLIYIQTISTYAALILKQELLSIGADLATPKQTLTSKQKVNCLIIANQKQLKLLYKKLQLQSISLKLISKAIKQAIANDSKTKYKIKTSKQDINIKQPLIMGIINATPDSFSGDGLLGNKRQGLSVKDKAQEMVTGGVNIFDVGGESTRPFSKRISTKEEIKRVVPIIKLLKKCFPKIPISIDTYKPEVAKAALKAGACIINDITALRSKKMIELVLKTKAGVCLMHMQGTPTTMQKKPKYKDVVNDVYTFFHNTTQKIIDMGIDPQQIILDVGIGFGKSTNDNLKLIKHHKTFKSLGFPLLLGVSRKSLIGNVLNKKDPKDRILGTSILNAIGLNNGANILRVHDVKQAKDTIKMIKAVIEVD